MKHHLVGLVIFILALVAAGLGALAVLLFASAAIGVFVLHEVPEALFVASLGFLSLILARSIAAWIDL